MSKAHKATHDGLRPPKKKILEGWDHVRNLKEKTPFRFNTRSDTTYDLIIRGKKYFGQSQTTKRTVEVKGNKLVYLEY